MRNLHVRGCKAAFWPLLATGALRASTAQARDVFVVISGGGSPSHNNYSQPLQARAYVNYLIKK